MPSSALRSSRIENWSRPPTSSRTEAGQVIPPMLDRIDTANTLTEIAGVRIELIKRGTGRPLLLLHPAIGIKSTDRVIEDIARSFTVIALASSSDDDAQILFRNREATALFAWSPYMYDPKLAGRLHRIKVPTLVLWGASDGIALPDYGRAYSRLISGAQFELIEDAGHYPHIERPDLFTRKIVEFVSHTKRRET